MAQDLHRYIEGFYDKGSELSFMNLDIWKKKSYEFVK